MSVSVLAVRWSWREQCGVNKTEMVDGRWKLSAAGGIPAGERGRWGSLLLTVAASKLPVTSQNCAISSSLSPLMSPAANGNVVKCVSGRNQHALISIEK